MTTTTTSLLSIVAPQQSQLGFNGVSRLSIGRIALTKSSSNPISLRSSSQTSTSASVVAEEEEEEAEEVSPSPSSDALPPQSDPDSFPPSSGCKACGREEIEKGCNGEGRIQGGIATVPGFGWWPIKAYRPCPGFLASGGRYRRRGQSMDEVAFGRGDREASMATDEGRGDRGASMATDEESKSRKKQGPRKFKR